MNGTEVSGGQKVSISYPARGILFIILWRNKRSTLLNSYSNFLLKNI